MKLLSWNIAIHDDNNAGVIDFIRTAAPDIAGFQEATRSFDKQVNDRYRSATIINDALSELYPYSFFAPLFAADRMTGDGKETYNFGGLIEQGSHLISSHPIRAAQSMFYYNHYAHWFDHSDFREHDWARNLQVCIVEIDGRLVKILNVHGMVNPDKLGNERTAEQVRFIKNEALKDDMPVIIMGDFNLVPESASMQPLYSGFRNLCAEYGVETTRPASAEKGKAVIDYIFVNDKVRVNDFAAIDNDVSDHFPLLLDFDL